MKAKIFITLIIITIISYGCKCWGDPTEQAFIKIAIVDNKTDRNILIGDNHIYKIDTIAHYFKSVNNHYRLGMYIDSTGVIQFIGDAYKNNEFTFFLNKTDSINISYDIIQSGYTENGCWAKYIYANFSVNNDTICKECPDTTIYYITID